MMNILSDLHTLSGILFVASFAIKIPLHAYLDFKIGKKNTVQSIVFFPLTYLGLYQNQVEKKYQFMKKACTILFCLGMISLVVNVIVGILEL
jgi:hypothetical protein